MTNEAFRPMIEAKARARARFVAYVIENTGCTTEQAEQVAGLYVKTGTRNAPPRA